MKQSNQLDQDHPSFQSDAVLLQSRQRLADSGNQDGQQINSNVQGNHSAYGTYEEQEEVKQHDFNPNYVEEDEDENESEDLNQIQLLEIQKNKKILQLEILEMEEQETKLKLKRAASRSSFKNSSSQSKFQQQSRRPRSAVKRDEHQQQVQYTNGMHPGGFGRQTTRKPELREFDGRRYDQAQQRRGRQMDNYQSINMINPAAEQDQQYHDQSSFEYFDKKDLSDNSQYAPVSKKSAIKQHQPQSAYYQSQNDFTPQHQSSQQQKSEQFESPVGESNPSFNKSPKNQLKLPQVNQKLRNKDKSDFDNIQSNQQNESLFEETQQILIPLVENHENQIDKNILNTAENRNVETMRNQFDSISQQIHEKNPSFTVEPIDSDSESQYSSSDESRRRKKKKKDKKKRNKSKRKSRRKTQSPEKDESVLCDQGHELVDGRVPPPCQPQSYLNWIAVQKGPTGGSLMQGDDEDDQGQQNFFEPLSYKKLQRVISTFHPVNPETKTRYTVQDRITVKDYESKISDCCFCYVLSQKIKITAKFLRKKFRSKDKRAFVKPESMIDLPDSGSDSSDGDDDKGLTKTCQALGDGASLYLQMMKTLAIMFLVLSILNFPLFVVYEQSTQGNELGALKTFFKYFSIGNMGQLTKFCGSSNFNYKFELNQEIPGNIEVDCGDGYLAELTEFGFLYTIDKVYGGPSDGEATCSHIENPMDPYKIPPPFIRVCDENELEDDALQICLIDQRLDKEEITEEEATTLKAQLGVVIPSLRFLEGDATQTNQTVEVPHVEHEVWEPQGKIPDAPDTSQEIVFTNIDPKCHYTNYTKKAKTSPMFQNKDSQTLFSDYFAENCYDQQKCILDPDKMGYQIGELADGEPVTDQQTGLFGLISDDCKLRMSAEEYDQITSNVYIAIFGCKYDEIAMPFVDDVHYHKEVIGVFIVVIDFVSILVMMFFFGKINSINNEFLECVDDLRVTMKDFGIKIDNVKLDRYTQDSRVIKIKVWLHFKEILQKFKDSHNDMQCIDVCLSLYTQPSIQCVFRMQEIQLEINNINNKLMTNQYKEHQIPDKQEDLKSLYDKQKRFETRYKSLIQKKVHKEGDNLTVQRISKSQRIKQIQFIFVIFKNCETSDYVLDTYQKESNIAACIKSCMPQQTKEKKQTKLLFGKQLDVVPILEPDEIIWQNLAYTGDEQMARQYAVQVFSFFFLIFNTLFTMYLSGFKVFMNRKIPEAVGCPDIQLTKEEVFFDYLKDFDDDLKSKSTGLMGCYCKVETTPWLPWTLIGHNFSDQSDGGSDTKNYCLVWWGLQYLKEISLFFVSTSAVFINEFVADLFQQLGQFQKKHTKIEEQITCFRQIFTQEYINMGIIVLITSFDQLGITDKLLGDFSSNANVYREFEPNWYMDHGNKICIFIFMSSFLINSKDIVRFVITAFYRCYDRKFRLNMKLDADDEGCDQPNSRIRIQSDLEGLYKGKIFKGEKAYSRMMSTMFVIQMYSSGMPFLYLNGFVFYVVTYWVNKFLLIYYYQKSRTLTRTIPLFTMEYLKYGLLLHMVMGCFMLTNKEAFITKSKFQGVRPIFDAKEQHERLEAEGKIQGGPFAESLIDRVQFAHQQIYFGFMIFWILFYFVGKTTYTVLTLIGQALAALIKSGLQRFFAWSKLRIQMALDKEAAAIEIHKQAVAADLLAKVQAGKEKIEQEKIEAEELEDIMQAEELAAQSDASSRRRVQAEHLLDDLKEMEDEMKEEQAEMDAENQQIDIQNQIIDDLNGDEIIDVEKQKQIDRQVKLELQQKRLDRPDYSDNIIQEMSCDNLSNFYERCKKELEDFWDIFQYDKNIDHELLSTENDSPYKVLFLETCYTYRISVDQCFLYQDFLNQRIKDIEDTIDKYFDLLKPTLIKTMKKGFERDNNRRKKENKDGSLKDQVAQRKYEEWFIKHSDDVQFDDAKYWPYTKKMKILVEFQEELIAADKSRKENRQGIQDICRMTGSLTQSYFIFDAQPYKVGRKIYYGIQQEDEIIEDNLEDILGEGAEQEPNKDTLGQRDSYGGTDDSSSEPEQHLQIQKSKRSQRTQQKSQMTQQKSSRSQLKSKRDSKPMSLAIASQIHSTKKTQRSQASKVTKIQPLK